MRDIVDSFDFEMLYSTVEDLHARNAGRNVDRGRTVRLVHIVNPVDVPADHDLARAQSVTNQTMREAAAFAARNDPALTIEFVSTQFPEDAPAVPSDFFRLPELQRDSTMVGNFNVPRKLPLVDEIISRASEYIENSPEVAEQTYIVFTNVDIGVLPHFYCYAAWLVRSDHDVSMINRRQIKDFYRGIEDLPNMLTDFGHIHPGLDCFIFDANLVSQFIRHNSIIGMAHVMRPLFFNLMAFARNPVILTDAHATFHIGIDRAWRAEKFRDYDVFNRQECLKVIAVLSEDPVIEGKLRQFVQATEEHRWIPDGVLGVVKPNAWQRVAGKVRNRLRRITRLSKELVRCCVP